MTNNRSPDDGYTKARTGMRKFGPAMVVIGGLMVLIGVGQLLLTILSAANSQGFADRPDFPVLFIILGFPGMILLGIGMSLTQFGYLKEITKYAAKETTPAVTTSVTAIRSAITDDDVPCPACSSPNEPGSRFCSSCGVQIEMRKCRSCDHSIQYSDRFCPSCGQKTSVHTGG
tara:strand:- start:148070 stop:148588 length:519 start_codon:yes stop_codon:yes gene_type:complete